MLAADFWVPGLQRIIPLHAAQRTGHDTAMTSRSRGMICPSFSNFVVPLLK
jgi:hypothetical protein